VRKLALFLSAVLLLAASPLTPERRRLELQSFEYVWKTIRDKHWDPRIGGVDWQGVHDELLPKIMAAETEDEARAVLMSMLQRLHQTHFGIIPSDAYRSIRGEGESASDDGQTGIDLRMIDGRPIVTSVAEDSASKQAGVRAGWEVARVGDAEIAPMLKNLAAPDLMAMRAVRLRLDGPVNSRVKVEFSDLEGRHLTKEITRKAEPGELTRFGFLPPQVIQFESRKLPAGAEYIRFNLFLQPDVVVTRFGQAIHDCGKCPGVIIDLRGNPGGIGAMAMGMAGFLISKPDQKLGTMYLRTLPVNFVIFPRPEVYDGPVAVLVDSFTASTSEIFAGGLQDLKRARIFGQKTAGAALPSQFERLPNGDGFQYAIANYISQGGRQLEGNGVTPDVVVPLDRKWLSEGRDAVLESALDWIRQQSEHQREGL